MFNASLLVDEGLGYALCFDKLINVTGDSTLYIAIDVMTELFDRSPHVPEPEELRRRVDHIESACAQLTESAGKLIKEIADVTTAILQSIAQADDDEEDKPDEA